MKKKKIMAAPGGETMERTYIGPPLRPREHDERVDINIYEGDTIMIS